MSSILQTPRIKTTRLIDNRTQILLLAAAVIAMLVVILGNAAGSPQPAAMDFNAYMLYRQGEWLSVPIPADPAEAYALFRLGEVTSPAAIHAAAYALFRLGEVTSPAQVNAAAYSLYRQGEWISVPLPAVDLSAYHLSERTMTDPQAGMAVYHTSERTRIPVRFTPYQRSEWFGE